MSFPVREESIPQMLKPALILYDLDGTLVDTGEDITRAANFMLSEMGDGSVSRKEAIGFVGRGLRQFIQNCLKTEDAGKTEAGMKLYRRFYSQHLLDNARLYPFTRDLLEHFQSRKQAVITNKPNPYSREILAALGVVDFFVEVIAGDSEYAKKPDPASVLSIMKRQGASAEKTLLVGDSPIDVETGRNAGIRTVGVLHGFTRQEELKAAGPDWMVRDFRQLLEMVRRDGW